MEQIATAKKEPIDPTGAGDAFAAGFVYGFLDYMAQKKDRLCVITSDAIRISMLWGCASGSCCVMINGASVPPEKKIIEQMLKDVRTNNEAKGVKRPSDET